MKSTTMLRMATQPARVLSSVHQKNVATKRNIRKYTDASNNKNLQKAAVAAAAKAEPFLSGTSSVYMEEMYESWLIDPESVHKVSFRLLL